MKVRVLALLAAAGVAVGCDSTPPPVAAASDVTGTVTLNGKPAGSVVVMFNPVTAGINPGSAVVGADGKFTVKLAPGQYVYLFEAEAGKANALKAIPPSYLTPDAAHTLDVAGGQPISLALQK